MDPRNLRLDVRLPPEAVRALSRLENLLDGGLRDLLALSWWEGALAGGGAVAIGFLAVLALVALVTSRRKPR